MYIAFKWLLGLTLVMWLAICCLDVFITKNIITSAKGLNVVRPVENFANKTDPVKRNFHTKSFIRTGWRQSGTAYLHCLMFIAGALLVSTYNRIAKLIRVLHRESFTTSKLMTTLQEFSIVSIITGKKTITAARNVYQKIIIHLKNIAMITINVISAFYLFLLQKQRITNDSLVKLKEIGEDKKKLAELLAAAIQESKSLRMQYELESLAKKRLTQHIEETQKIMKENRARYIRFQQLYLVTHQENIFLKSRLVKLTKEKEEAERNLLELMHEVFKSKNSDLKAFCSRFIVKTKKNLLNSNVGAEIEKFLHKSRAPLSSVPEKWQLAEKDMNFKANITRNLPKSSSCTEITEFNNEETLISLEPKLKGLPGECVWTVKDKHGLIEKLYEYDCDSDLDNGDTIRRIREYSVYYDKDCLLDFSNSSTVVNESRNVKLEKRSSYENINNCPRQRFLTGSEAFQNFMQKNRNFVPSTMLPAPTPFSD